MGKLIDVKSTPIQETIETLLQDKTTGKNIIWASNCYAEEGFGTWTASVLWQLWGFVLSICSPDPKKF